MKDKIVSDVRKIRKEIDEENGGDWNKIEKDLLERQSKHNVKIYRGKPKPLPVQHLI